MTAYCVRCKKSVSVTVTPGTLVYRDVAKCDECGRTWPIGRSR